MNKVAVLQNKTKFSGWLQIIFGGLSNYPDSK